MKRTLYKNAIFHPMTGRGDVFHAMEVEDGIIKAVYDKAPEHFDGEVISLEHRHVYPCLIDGHIHMLLTIAVMAMGFNVCEITENGVEPNTLKGVEEKIRDYSSRQGKNAVIAANNYILSAMDECRLPTREELDEWSGGRAVAIYNIDGHSSALSSKMLEKIGINPEGHSGVLTGEEHEKNQGKLTDVIGSSISVKTLARGVAEFQNTCAKYGISTVGALEGNGDSERDTMTDLLVRIARHIDTRVCIYYQYADVSRAERLSKYQRKKRIGGCGDFELDGSVGSHSASFSHPYLDSSEAAPLYYSDEKIESVFKEAHDRGYQTAAHAIGENAIDQIVSLYEKSTPPVFCRIEHCEFPSAESAEKIKEGKWAVMVQPGYSWIDKRYLHSYEKFLEKDVIDSMRLKSFFDAAVCVCGSSDSPVQDMDPFLQMLGMVQFYREDESVDAYTAMKSYTANAARAVLEDDRIGTLEVGKTADFFTADEDFFTLTGQEIASFRPVETYYAGKPYSEKKGTAGELLLQMLGRAKKI